MYAVVANNLLATNANRQLGIVTDRKKKSSEKLASGYRINRAADDAAGLKISEKLRVQIRGLHRGQKNTMDGISWCQTGDGALQEIENMVQRIRELAVQASNDTNMTEDRDAIDQEVQALRKEINKTSTNAIFNGQHIFSKESSLAVVGVPNDLKVYTANTNITADSGITTDDYGGVIFDGKRIPWNEIDATMVDRAASPDVFNDGTYTWQESGTERGFTVRVDGNGTTMPKFTREMTITADQSGVHVDGFLISWGQVKDEEGASMNEANVHDGIWSFDYKGATVTYYLSAVDTMEDVYEEIGNPSSGGTSYEWEVPYVGYQEETAVDAAANKVIQVTNKMKQTLYTNDGVIYTVKADQNGMALVDANGTEVGDSRRTWNEFFGSAGSTWNDWVHGTRLDAQQNVVYTYTDSENGAFDTDIEFTFSLSDITGLDDVIEGLNGMPIEGHTATSYRAVDVSANAAKNVTVSTSTLLVSYAVERALGRDFDQKQIDNVSTGSFSYEINPATGVPIVKLKLPGASTVELQGAFTNVFSEAGLESKLMSGVDQYIARVIAARTDKLMGVSTTVVPPAQTSVTAKVTGAGSMIVSTLSYDHKQDHLENDIQVTMKDAADGAYVKNADGITYRAYNAAIDGASVQRYDVNVTYAGAADRDDFLAQHQAKVMESLFGTSGSGGAQIQLDARNYTYVGTSANELPNDAKRSMFKSVVLEKKIPLYIHIQNSANVGDAIEIPQFPMNTIVLGMSGTNTKTYDDAQRAIDECDYAISVINDRRGIFGATQNRLEHTLNNSANAEENQQTAESRIRDTDMSAEMVINSRETILQQTGQAMLAQANQMTQGILSLLQ